MHQSIDKKQKYLLYLIIFLFLTTINNFSLIRSKELLSNIKTIEVSGLKNNLNLSIKKNFEFLLNNNIFQIEKELLENKLDLYNYLQNYKVFKLYPSKIIIKLTQTNLLATTIKNNQKYIIGSNGKLINFEIFNINNDLPHIFGNFTGEDFILLTKIINQTEFDYNNIKDFFFFPSERWDIKTKNNVTIKLPIKDIKYAFIKAQNIIKSNELNNNNIIDLRIANRVILLNE
tara:strand:- start:323 stop:1015 length:693 start_codon:yes stop_codon:yes gene_type:complete